MSDSPVNAIDEHTLHKEQAKFADSNAQMDGSTRVHGSQQTSVHPPTSAAVKAAHAKLAVKAAHELAVDFQMARASELKGDVAAAKRDSMLGNLLAMPVWAANLAPQGSEQRAPSPAAIRVVPTPCSVLSPGCLFTSEQKTIPPLSPTSGEALGLGFKLPALVAQCKYNRQWVEATKILKRITSSGRSPTHKDVRLVIEGCNDPSGESWATGRAALEQEVMIATRTRDLKREHS
jgi:hypothetical protein